MIHTQGRLLQAPGLPNHALLIKKTDTDSTLLKRDIMFRHKDSEKIHVHERSM